MKNDISVRLAPAMLALVGVTAGCTAHTSNLPEPSATVYSSSEVNKVMRFETCRVVDARQISIVSNGAKDEQRAAATQGVGILAGAMIGHALGKELGNDDDFAKNVGILAGGVAGNAVGRGISDTQRMKQGVRYTVQLEGGDYRTIVQNMNPGDYFMSPGARCTLSGANANKVRVLPV